MNTTLNEIREQSPCHDGWQKLLSHLGKTKADDDLITFKTILESNGIEDAVWCLRTLSYKDQCLFRADVAESVLHIFEKRSGSDAPRKAIQAVRDYHDGLIGLNELRSKRAAADAAAYTASYTASYAAADAAYAYAVAAAAAAGAATTAGKDKWAEIEQLFIKHFCGEALEAK